MGSCGENHDALVTMAILTMALLYYGAHAAGALVGAQSLLTHYLYFVRLSTCGASSPISTRRPSSGCMHWWARSR